MLDTKYTEQEIINRVFDDDNDCLNVGGTTASDPSDETKYTVQLILNRIYNNTKQAIKIK